MRIWQLRFGTATFLVEKLLRIKYLRKNSFVETVLLHSISFFRRATSKKLIFQKRNIQHFLFFWRATFSELRIHSLNGTIFILTGELAVIHCLSNSFSSRYCNHFLEYSQASILSTVLCIFLMLLKFAAIQFGQRTFFQRISERQSP